MDGISAGLKLAELVPSAVTAILVIFVVIYLTRQSRVDRKECSDSMERSADKIVRSIDTFAAQNETCHAETRSDIRDMGTQIVRLREDLVRRGG